VSPFVKEEGTLNPPLSPFIKGGKKRDWGCLVETGHSIIKTNVVRDFSPVSFYNSINTAFPLYKIPLAPFIKGGIRGRTFQRGNLWVRNSSGRGAVSGNLSSPLFRKEGLGEILNPSRVSLCQGRRNPKSPFVPLYKRLL